MPDSFPWGKEAAHFLNVINGTILLHCEDQSMLRLCLSTLLGAIRKFTLLFPRDGYAHIIPTLLRVYAAHSTYNFVVKSIEVCETVTSYCLYQDPLHRVMGFCLYSTYCIECCLQFFWVQCFSAHGSQFVLEVSLHLVVIVLVCTPISACLSGLYALIAADCHLHYITVA